MPALATRTMPSASSTGPSPASAAMGAHGRVRACSVQAHAAAQEPFGHQPAQEEVGVGHGDAFTFAVAHRGRGRPRRSRAPTVSAPPASSAATEPPPAPTVWMSIMGTLTG